MRKRNTLKREINASYNAPSCLKGLLIQQSRNINNPIKQPQRNKVYFQRNKRRCSGSPPFRLYRLLLLRLRLVCRSGRVRWFGRCRSRPPFGRVGLCPIAPPPSPARPPTPLALKGSGESGSPYRGFLFWGLMPPRPPSNPHAPTPMRSGLNGGER